MENILRKKIAEAVKVLYNGAIDEAQIQIQETRKEFTGDFTFVVFPLMRFSKNTPEKTADDIGKYLAANLSEIEGYNVIKGFLNISIGGKWWTDLFSAFYNSEDLFADCRVKNPEVILVEYSSPNTNKPLHLGHIRNNLLGFSIFRILESCGHKVIKTNIVNDRGIHICKSMLAWVKFGNGETPETSGMKGDHLVGKYYVMFETAYKAEVENLLKKGYDDETARLSAPMMVEAREMLVKWEAGDEEVVRIWKMMNSWVYEGFEETYRLLGVDFDKIYYESETWKDGKEQVLKALEKNILFRKEDGSVWADLTGEGLDQKVLLRSDGTAVYITQDIGTAIARQNDYHFSKCLYVVGNEQNYHFQVLKAILKKMGYEWSDGLIHFSYGMVELPEGRMKSREGTVVDADDIIREMIATARELSAELGKLEAIPDEDKDEIFRKIGLGALKYFILKVDPKKNMTFNPAESIDFNGNTGPFIQYTYARIKSVMRKARSLGIEGDSSLLGSAIPCAKEVGLIKLLRKFAAVVTEASETLNPSLIANYCYDLAKEFNQYYHDYSILGEKDPVTRNFRLLLSGKTSVVLYTAMWLLGIEMPERM